MYSMKFVFIMCLIFEYLYWANAFNMNFLFKKFIMSNEKNKIENVLNKFKDDISKFFYLNKENYQIINNKLKKLKIEKAKDNSTNIPDRKGEIILSICLIINFRHNIW